MESDDATTKGEVIIDTDATIDGTVVVKGEDSQTPSEKVAAAAGTESKDTSDDTAVDDVGVAMVAATATVAAKETRLIAKRKGPRDSSSDPSCNHPAAGDASKKARADTDVDNNNNNNNNNIEAQNYGNSTSASTASVGISSSASAVVQSTAVEFNERTKMAMNKFVEEHKCPLTTELLCDPVTAEDGHNYEREMIEILINDAHNKRSKKPKKLLRSPRTNEPMGKEIKSDVSLRNTIQNFIESGLIGGEVADSWRQRKLIIDTKKKAENGDPDAMQ